ncbi:DNA-binding protein Alba [Candidatus Micrarchaeota archaeon]|nr:DNA-binding protein Alba [Candidatus Micrarchaeota archaeon]
MRDRNTVYIGKKNVMSYVLAAVTQLNSGSSEVKIKARGKAISRAVDVTQITKNRFFKDIKITLADISTEELASEDGTMSKVSSVTLLLSK